MLVAASRSVETNTQQIQQTVGQNFNFQFTQTTQHIKNKNNVMFLYIVHKSIKKNIMLIVL
jgi:hypothetical protein